MQCTRPFLLEGERLVPCGKCTACRIRRTSDWTLRLLHELESWDDATFITITYDDEHLPPEENLEKTALQKWFKRLRKQLDERRIKYYACGEYGDKFERPHYHAIVFGLNRVHDKETVEDTWPYGHVYMGTVTADSIKYVAGYVHKKYSAQYEYPGKTPPFQLQSQGLGLEFAMQYKDRFTKDLSTTIKGTRVGLPRYYIKKLEIDPEKREALAKDRVKDLNEQLSEHSERQAREIVIADRRQRERNLKSKTSLKNKGKL